MKVKCLDSLALPVIGQGGTVYRENQVEVLRRGIELGANFIDTAENYGTEKVVGKVISEERDGVIVGTKFSPENNNNVTKAAKRSLRNLGTDYLDLYQLHWPNPAVPLRKTIQEMESLVKNGLVNYIGLCNTSLREIEEVKKYLKDVPISTVQLEYNLFDRTAENKIIKYCEKNKILFIAYSPIDRGRITNGKKQTELLQRLSKKYQKTSAQIALNWLINRGPVVAIPKSGTLSHVEENAEACNFHIDKKDMNSIDLTKTKIVYVKPSNINIVGGEYTKMYKTVREAKQNRFNLIPSPKNLSVITTENMKPVRLVKTNNEYNLVEGQIRYWAWVIVFGDTPIPSLIRENWK